MDPSDFSHGYYDHPDTYPQDDGDDDHHHHGFPEAPPPLPEKEKDSSKKDDGEEKAASTEEDDPVVEAMVEKKNRRRRKRSDQDKENEKEDEEAFTTLEFEPKITDPEILAQVELIDKSTPTTDLEVALSNALSRKQAHIDRITAELVKLKKFVSKRKQTYKRKRLDDTAPTRALSAYNIFIQVRTTIDQSTQMRDFSTLLNC